MSDEFRYPFWKSCESPSKSKSILSVQGDIAVHELFRNKPHTAESHRNGKNRFLSPIQRCANDRSLVTNSTATAKQIMLYQMNWNTLVLRSIVTCGIRNKLLAKQMEGVEMSGKSEVQISKELCEGQMI